VKMAVLIPSLFDKANIVGDVLYIQKRYGHIREYDVDSVQVKKVESIEHAELRDSTGARILAVDYKFDVGMVIINEIELRQSMQ